MTEIDSLRPLAAVLAAALPIVAILASHRRPNVREGWSVASALGTFAVVASMVPGVLGGDVYVTDLGTFVFGVEFALRADGLGTLFALLASFLWIITTFYSIGYMRGLDEHDQTRYFASFAASVAAAVGVAFGSNLLVLFVFYELLTVATYPLVTHDEDAEARAAGRKYLTYTFGGGVAVLAGIVLVYWLTGTVAFAAGGIEGLGTADPTLARAAFALLAGGFGVKAALMPMHSWLPDAMVAPTPVSGLLHAVAVVKSGVFGVARVVLDVFGPEAVADLGVGVALAAVAAFTLLTASVIALRQDNLKRRLAYSTVSQLSYIVLGLGVGAYDATGLAMTGGLLHIPAHAFMKLTLFFCAGAIHVETHTDDISNMAGIGRRMPLTMAAFGVASLGMAGIPLLAGFVSKWYLLLGSVSAGYAVFAVALLLSGVLNIAYFWPIVYQAFFQTAADADTKPLIENPFGGKATPSAVAARDDAANPLRPDGGDRDDRNDRVRDDEETYAVDQYPSDHLADDGESADGDVERDGDHEHHGYDEYEDKDPEHHHDHHAGPPAGGWERRGFGDESTWFMLGPISTAALGAIALGVVPHSAVFLRIVDHVVTGVMG
ncbi:monovalent cation/H+ antiporter subunit D family protein [Halostella sp. JP-L12]|uniref:cation:proton antiporter n=1 Tax=Halostella TaxID=1843185 RepID=UPI000EF7CDEC|nr:MULTISPECIES: cation:proton antiporter [Halostella]NHN47395.1 monovalent cation/H+ antiporter subunit D family protein [Halostella sp. JP-L12]